MAIDHIEYEPDDLNGGLCAKCPYLYFTYKCNIQARILP